MTAPPEPPAPPADEPPARPDPAEVTRALRALSQDVRLSLLAQLAAHGTLCVTQLSATQVRESSTISRHLTHLTSAGLVHFRQQGQQRFYALERQRLRQLLDDLAALLGV